jgi:hypothetical protein
MFISRGLGVWGLGLKGSAGVQVQGLGLFRVCAGFRVQGVRFRVQRSGLNPKP